MAEADIVVSPERFKDVSQKALREYEEVLRKYWNKPSKFTDIWGSQSGGEGIYTDIEKDLGLKFQHEYRGVDAAYFKNKCPLSNASNRERADVLSVAIEHENAANGSETDMNSLLTFTALLKVLVTYPYERSWEEGLFESYSSQIKVLDKAIPDYSTHQKIVVVFGYLTGRGKPIVWRYFNYDASKGFQLYWTNEDS